MSIERDLERRIRSASFSNDSHKDSLKAKIMDSSAELSVDDLTGVTGGSALDLAPPIDETWNPWPTPEQAVIITSNKK